MTPAAQPDEAAGLVEKCARALCGRAIMLAPTPISPGAPVGYCKTHGHWLMDGGRGYCGQGQRDAKVAVSVLVPAIREQHTREIEAADKAWDTAIDYLLNSRYLDIEVSARFWAYCDGLITEDELRGEVISVDEINDRRERGETDAD